MRGTTWQFLFLAVVDGVIAFIGCALLWAKPTPTALETVPPDDLLMFMAGRSVDCDQTHRVCRSRDGKMVAFWMQDPPSAMWSRWPKWMETLGIAPGRPRSGVKLCDLWSGAELAYFQGADRAAYIQNGTAFAVASKGNVEVWQLPIKAGPPMSIRLALACAAGLVTFAGLRWWWRRRRMAAKTALAPVPEAQLASPSTVLN